MLLALSLLTRSWLSVAKVQVATVTFGSDAAGRQMRWQYVSKFGFGLGNSRYSIRMREKSPRWLPNGTKLRFEAYLDEEWPAAEMETDECQRGRIARYHQALSVGAFGEWGTPLRRSIAHKVRSHMWYFGLSACDFAFLQNGTYSFEVEIDARQEDGSHFGVEHRLSPYTSAVTLLVNSAFLACFYYMSRQFRDKVGYLHPAIWTLATVVAVQYAAQLLHIGNLALIASGGAGSPLLEAFAEILFASSHTVQTSLLIMIAMGYTLTRSELGALERFLPVCCLVALVHVALVVLDKLQGEASHRFTDHDGMKGWIFLALRVALFAWFLTAARATSAASGLKVQAVMGRFQLAASMYFLAYPAVFFLMPLVAPYFRRPAMELGLMAAQVCANVWLAAIFLDRRGAYYEASCLSASPLPGGRWDSPRFFKDD